MQSFVELGVPEPVLHALERMQFTTPTPIQVQAIPHALAGKDVLGSAQTGTGKTAAFGIPLVSYLLENPGASALVLTPVRELAEQVLASIRPMLGAKSGVRDVLLIGGASIRDQLRQLRTQPRLLVGTPGRVYDHIQRGSLSLGETGFLALDETDRMLDMGFEEQLEAIASYLPENRRTLMFSATIHKRIEKLAMKYMRDPVRISAGPANVAAPTVKQDNVYVSEAEKFGALLLQLKQRQGAVIVFINTKRGAEALSNRLRDEGHETEALHGDLRQFQRQKALRAFRRGAKRVLVATDVASRGLDIPEVGHVINYELPMRAEDYIHRIGRTGRAGAEGEAVNLVGPRDKEQWRAIDIMLNPEKRQERSPHGARRPKTGFGGKRRFGGSPFGSRPQTRGDGPGKGAGFGGGFGGGPRPHGPAREGGQSRPSGFGGGGAREGGRVEGSGGGFAPSRQRSSGYNGQGGPRSGGSSKHVAGGGA